MSFPLFFPFPAETRIIRRLARFEICVITGKSFRTERDCRRFSKSEVYEFGRLLQLENFGLCKVFRSNRHGTARHWASSLKIALKTMQPVSLRKYLTGSQFFWNQIVRILL